MATSKAKSKKKTSKKTTRRAATKKKAARRTRGKTAGKKVAKKKVAKKAAARSPLGREGTVSHFFRQQITETKKDKAAVLRDARAKFSDRDVPDGYYAWYRRDCVKRGLIDA